MKQHLISKRANIHIRPHLTKKYLNKWTIMWHKDSEYFIWSNPDDFEDACRYLRLSYINQYGKHFKTAEESI